MPHNFFWVLVNSEFEKIKDFADEVLPKEYFRNPDRIHSFHFFDGDRPVCWVDLVHGYFAFGNNNMVDLAPEITAKNPQFRLIYVVHRAFDFTPIGNTPVKDLLLGYKIGWQATIDGVNHQRILYINPLRDIIEIRMRK